MRETSLHSHSHSQQQSARYMVGGKRPHKAAGQQSSPTVFPERWGKVKPQEKNEVAVAGSSEPDEMQAHEHKIDIVDEQSDLLGYAVFHGKLALVKKNTSTDADHETNSGSIKPVLLDAKLTSKALLWGSHMLHVEDVISVSYNDGLQHFTVHSYPIIKRPCFVSCFSKPRRIQKDYRFLASSAEEAIQWVSGFADQQCFINCSANPMVSSKKQALDVVTDPIFDLPYIKRRSPPRILVILNPRSGHGRSMKVFHGKVEQIFKLAGFMMEVVKTTYAGHAKNLAATVDFSTCPDGIVCVGGDGIVNEVLNGLLCRDNQKEAISIPIGIIPAGSDNSLVWTILGVRDPVSAAMAIVKGGLTATDVFAVEWIQTGIIHFGTTATYFGFASDVLELSEKYQKRFGPLRYFVAGFLKFLCMPKYSFEIEYLPVSKEMHVSEGQGLEDKDRIDMSDLYKDIMRRSKKEGIPRASSFSSIDSIMSPSRVSEDLDTTGSTFANSEPSEYVRGLDAKSKRVSSGRSNLNEETEEVVHPQHHLSTNSNWPRTRLKSRVDKGCTGLTSVNDSRFSWGVATLNDKEDISSTMSDPGPIWDYEPKWDTEPKWDNELHMDVERAIQFPGPQPDDIATTTNMEPVPDLEEKWVVKKGHFLGVLVCNHSCKTVQTSSSQVVAPKAVHDDNSLDLLLVHGSGRMRLLRFIVCLQFGRHISLPFVEYVKVKSVKIRPGKMMSHNGCGIDGELRSVNGQVICSLLPEQCRLIGRPIY